MTESIKYKEYATIGNRTGQWLVGNNKKYTERDLYGYFGRTADKNTIRTVLKQRYNDNIFTDDGLTCEYTECAVQDNSKYDFMPNYTLGTNGVKYNKDVFIDMARRVSAFEVVQGVSPNIVYVDNPNKIVPIGNLTKQLSNKLGVNITGASSLYNAFNNAKYSYYLNDIFTQAQALTRLFTGLNCVDLNQLAYYSLKELGWGDNVRIVRGVIRCSGKDYGHVWCQIRENNIWKHFDVSAAAKYVSRGNVICGTVREVTNINPLWAVLDDGKT